jgi:hypothetical protein
MTRPGFAVLAVLMIVGAIELLTLASLALATHESVIADTRQRTSIARRAAQAELRSLVRDGLPPNLDSVLVGQSRIVSRDHDVVVLVQRHSEGLFELAASARTGQTAVSEAMIVRTLDYQRGIQELNEAVLAAGPLAIHHATLLASDGATCTLPSVPPRAASAVTVTRAGHAFGIPNAIVDSVHATPISGYAFAGLRWDEIASIADTMVNGSLEPAADSLINLLVYAPGDLVMNAGHASGILVVDGNLTLRGGVEFDGIIVVRGTVHIEDAVRISGALRIQGTGASTIGAADITYSRCGCARILRESPAGRRLIRAQRRFIPTF